MFCTDLLKSKRILITGGGTGLGKGMAQRFLQLGATVYICGRRQEVLKETCAHLARDTGGSIHSMPCDVRKPEAVEGMVEAIWKDGPLDVVVNNAAGNFLARTEELSPRAFEAVVGIVLMGTINVTSACGRKWLGAGHHATVLNITTTYASTGSAYVVPSAVAKAGVEALTRSLAVELATRNPRVRVNCIMPGPVLFASDLPEAEWQQAIQATLLKRPGRPENIAQAVLFFIDNDFVTGVCLPVDGGRTVYSPEYSP